MPNHACALRTLASFCTLVLAALLLASCATLNLASSEPTPVAAPHDIDIPAPDIAGTQADVAALTARIDALELRLAQLEQVLPAGQAPDVPETDASATPDSTQDTATLAPILIPTNTPAAPVTPGEDAPTEDGQSSEAQLEEIPSAPAGPTIDWQEARAYLDQTATVCGPVMAAQFAQQTNGQPTFLNVGRPFPDPDRFQVVIWGNQRANFPTPPEIAYRDTTICVTGLIGEFRGTVEVTILGPDEIWVVNE